jgi:uncharacterized protein with HEPN domain
MSKRVVELFVVDLLVAMDKISRYKAGFNDAQSFYHDEKSFDATIRELQIVGEATKHLISSNILGKEYRVIVDFRNLIVHEYFGIDADEIWNILNHELIDFKETVYILLKDFDKEILLKIIANTKEDSRGKTADFLQDLYDNVSGKEE